MTDEGSGTTVTGVALGIISDEPTWIVFNIGDSRVYRLVGGVLEQLTIDHSIVQELVDAGQITREEADTHPHSNVITRAVGFHEAPIPDYRAIAVEPGMRLLVCSDGLTKELTSYGIRHFLVANRPRREGCCAARRRRARQRRARQHHGRRRSTCSRRTPDGAARPVEGGETATSLTDVPLAPGARAQGDRVDGGPDLQW